MPSTTQVTNLVAGTNVTIDDDGQGNLTVNSSGGGGGSSGIGVAPGPGESEANPRLLSNITLAIANIPREVIFIEGDSNPVSLTASPRIANGSSVGQELLLIGTDDNNFVSLLGSGGNLKLNGPIVLKDGSSILFVWSGSNWVEQSRNDK